MEQELALRQFRFFRNLPNGWSALPSEFPGHATYYNGHGLPKVLDHRLPQYQAEIHPNGLVVSSSSQKREGAQTGIAVEATETSQFPQMHGTMPRTGDGIPPNNRRDTPADDAYTNPARAV